VFREWLSDRFKYEGQIGHFDQFIVFGAVYFDESGDDPRHKRIGIAASFADSASWLAFEVDWRAILTPVGREKDFHANRNDQIQGALNVFLAMLMKKHGIYSFGTTIDADDYRAATTPLQRGWYGNEYGFARYVSLILTGHALAKLDRVDFGYYVDQGGKGGDWIMKTMADIYRFDDLRASYRMATFGPVDRRKHLPVHAADLVAHEVITNRENSTPLAILGDNVEVDDGTREQIDGVMAEFTQLRMHMRHATRNRRARNKALRKQPRS
jgi:hypothetical protein